eukprot:3229295-Amphidinium_carterae.3
MAITCKKPGSAPPKTQRITPIPEFMEQFPLERNSPSLPLVNDATMMLVVNSCHFGSLCFCWDQHVAEPSTTNRPTIV